MKGGSRKKGSKRDTSRWGYIVRCEHDLQADEAFYNEEYIPGMRRPPRGNCPLCLLVHKETNSWLEEEKLQRAANKIESLRRGTELRRRLLIQWACNQLKNLVHHPTCPPYIEISICGQFSKSITSLGEYPSNKDMENLISYRERIAAVGNYAALFLQSRIRRYLCWRRVRKYMLLRFEFTPSNRKVPMDSYFDSTNGRRLYTTPIFLRKERASSPRTIQRRLRAEEAKRKVRYRTYLETLPKVDLTEEGVSSDLFVEKLKLIGYYRQLFVFKDVVMNAMMTLKSSAGAKELSSAGKSNDLRQNSYKKDDDDDDPVDSSYIPCWVSFSQPASSPYDISIATALQTTPFTSLLEEEGLMFGTPQFDEVINSRLRALDEIAYDSLRCDSPDDVLHHCFSEEMYPIFSSVERIATDSTIWKNQVEEQIDNKNVKNMEEIQDDTNDNINRPRLLPLTIKLHPFDSTKGFFNQFRLFFYNGRLAAACQVSKYAFHREILESKNYIINAIISFANSISIKSFVKSVAKTSTSCEGYVEQGRDASDFSIPTSTSHKQQTKGRTNMYVPDELDVFSSPPKFEQRSLGYDDYMTFGGTQGRRPRYPFLNRLSSWRYLYTKQKKKGRPPQKSRLPPPEGYYYDEFGNVQPISKKEESVETTFSEEVKALLMGVQIEESTGNKSSDTAQEDKDQETSYYVKMLEKLTLSTDLNMKQRIVYDEVQSGEHGNETQGKSNSYSDHQSRDQKETNLVVLEVFVDIPRIRIKKPDGGGKARAPGPAHASSLLQENNNGRYNIIVNRVVGAFSAFENDVPNGLDIGGFEWSFFQDLAADIAFQGEDKSSTNLIEKTGVDDFNDDVGMHTAQRRSGNRKIYFKFRGRNYQGMEEQQKYLPKKVKDFIGLGEEKHFHDALNDRMNNG